MKPKPPIGLDQSEIDRILDKAEGEPCSKMKTKTVINVLSKLAEIYFTLCAGFLIILGLYVRDPRPVIAGWLCLAMSLLVLPLLKKFLIRKYSS